MVREPVLADIGRKLRETVKPPALDGLSIYSTNYPAPTFLFDGLLANGLTILAGRPKSGKSWLTLQMAIDVALGRPFLGRYAIGRPARVLYCGLEESASRTHNRLRILLIESDQNLQNIQFRYALKPLAEGGAKELDSILAEGNYGLVVIDTFLRLVKAGGGSRDVMRSEYAEVTLLQELAQRHKLAIVLVHHTRKMAAESGLDSVAGTTGITAACDAVWTLRKQASGESILEITGREMEEQTLGLRLVTGDDFGWKLIGVGAEVGMSEARQEIVELLKDDAPLAPARIALLLKKNAVTIRRLLQKLAADGVVRKNSDGRYCLASLGEQRERVNGVNE
jgi:AAA domain